MIRSLVLAASLTACTTSEYGLDSFRLEGSSGVALDPSTGAVNVGMFSSVCSVDLVNSQNLDELVDATIDADVEEAEVVDAEDGMTMILDGGVILVVDPGTGEVVDVPPMGRQQGLDGVFYGDDVVALLDGCSVGWLRSGQRVAVPLRACPGALIAGDGLRLMGADGMVYGVTKDAVTPLGEADALAWHPDAALWLTAVGDAAQVEADGRMVWSTRLDGLIDVFPFGAEVGLRDADGVIWAVPAEGGTPRNVGDSGVVEGRAVGSLDGRTMVFEDRGMVLVRL